VALKQLSPYPSVYA